MSDRKFDPTRINLNNARTPSEIESERAITPLTVNARINQLEAKFEEFKRTVQSELAELHKLIKGEDNKSK